VNPKLSLLIFTAVASIGAFLTCTGCGSNQSSSTKTGSQPTAASTETTKTDAAVNRRELLQSAVNLFNSQEQFTDENKLDEQIVERLNQWRHANQSGDAKAAATPETLLETLPAELQKLRVLRLLDDPQYTQKGYDGPFIREAILLRDIKNHIQPSKLTDLSVAEALFDWTVRNIQLQAQPGADATPDELWLANHLPYDVVFFGRGTPLQRAWVFMLLARQAGLDVVLLALPDARNPDQPRPWVAALYSEGELYLFDFTYGLPIPGPGGKGIATLAQAAADDSILRQMDIPDRAYPRKAADLAKVTALIEASPGYLTSRIKELESKLSGNDRVVLSFNPSALVEKLRKVEHVGDVKLWALPYETLQQRLNVSQPVLQAAQLERFPFTIPAEPEPTSKKEDEPRRQERPIPALRLGRFLQLRGLYGNTDAERHGVPPGKELSEMMEHGAKYYYLRALPRQERLEELARMQRKGEVTQESLDVYQALRDDAAYWLGIVWLDLGAYKTATQYFGPLTLEASPNGPWSNGARYNLAQAYELLGQNDEAIKLYEADRSPQRYGSRLKAERLKAAKKAEAPAEAKKK
jgi:hypothetical protein